MLVCLLLGGLWLFTGAINDWEIGVPVACSVFIATLARTWVRARLIQRKPDPDQTSERLAKIALYGFCVVLFFFAGGLATWSCPHGSGFGVGPVGVARSAVGGPCRNHRPNLKSWHVRGNWYV
jgi:hypothetical protein